VPHSTYHRVVPARCSTRSVRCVYLALNSGSCSPFVKCSTNAAESSVWPTRFYVRESYARNPLTPYLFIPYTGNYSRTFHIEENTMRYRLLIPLAVLAIATLACGSATASEDAVQTAIAETAAAFTPTPQPTETEVPTETPTATVVPTSGTFTHSDTDAYHHPDHRFPRGVREDRYT
jgi:hypothetical protein